MGYAACINAGSKVQQGSIGAGMGATVGKVLGMTSAQKGGIGTASIILPKGVVVGALVCVNAFGDVVERGEVLAGAHRNGTHIGTSQYLMEHAVDPVSYTHLDIEHQRRLVGKAPIYRKDRRQRGERFGPEDRKSGIEYP